MVFQRLEPSHISFSYCKNIFSDFQLLTMALDISKLSASPRSQGLTSPGSPASDSATLEATVQNLKHLFENALYDLTTQNPPNTPVLEDNSSSALDMNGLKESLVKLVRNEYASSRTSVTNKSNPSVYNSNVTEKESEMIEKTGLETPIRTTPDDFGLFKKWASTPRFKKVLETYARLATISICFYEKLTLT